MEAKFACSRADKETAVAPTAFETAAARKPVLVSHVFATLGCLLLFAIPAKAATYYVSKSGRDTNSCATAQSTTPSNQKLTISAGVACLSAGDTLYIHGGTYTGAPDTIASHRTTVRGGTDFQAGAITIAAYPNETVTITPPDGYHGIALTTSAQQYLIFQDLIIDMINQSTPETGQNGIYVSGGANHNRFQRLEVKNDATSGIHFSPNNGNAPYNELINSKIHDNGRLAVSNSGYGIYLSTSNNLIEGNDFYNNNGYGVHLNGSSGQGNNNIIRGNKIHGNIVHGAPGTSGGSTSYGVVVMNGSGNLVCNNVIYANQGGIQVYSGANNTMILNNTVTGNLGHVGGGERGIELQYFGTGLTIRNNIIYNNANGPIMDWGGSSAPVIDHNLTTNPSFVDASQSDFRLQSGSAALDAGTSVLNVPFDYDGTARPKGIAYDIGAYEYGHSLAPPTSVRVLP